MTKEGSTEAPTRHAIDWRSEAFYDFDAIEKELERVFDICHGCRRCFNLCDSFPRLFDMIDESETGELDSLDPKTDYKPVVDACTLCDMCFMTKCPYVPPHEFDLDFPHLMLRYRAAEFRRNGAELGERELSQMDRNGKLARAAAPIANWASARGNGFARGVMSATLGLDADAELPKFHTTTFLHRAEAEPAPPNEDAPAFGRKAALYATCFVNYNNPTTGEAARAILAHNGVETEAVYPACCGMPYLEHGDLDKVAKQAETVSAAFASWIDQGYDVVALTASCGLMMKFEWPLILPDNPEVKRLSEAVFDIDEYIVDIAKTEGLAAGLQPLDGGVTAHMACHARAQNMGAKSAELLRLIPESKVDVVERCSGHGGTFGVMKETRELAVKVARPATRQIKKAGNKYLSSDCPLACKHLMQETQGAEGAPQRAAHPVELFAHAYGLIEL